MKKNKGSILVFILALIVLLSILCMRLMQETVQELRHVSQFHRRDDLRMHAYSALDLAVGVLNEFMMVEKTLTIRCKVGGTLSIIPEFLRSILRSNGQSH